MRASTLYSSCLCGTWSKLDRLSGYHASRFTTKLVCKLVAQASLSMGQTAVAKFTIVFRGSHASLAGINVVEALKSAGTGWTATIRCAYRLGARRTASRLCFAVGWWGPRAGSGCWSRLSKEWKFRMTRTGSRIEGFCRFRSGNEGSEWTAPPGSTLLLSLFRLLIGRIFTLAKGSEGLLGMIAVRRFSKAVCGTYPKSRFPAFVFG